MTFILYIWGNPLYYSLSPFFQEHSLILNNIKVKYKIFRGESHCFKNFLQDDRCAGANITTPFKKEAMKICDKLTKRAVESGSVNTIFKKNGKLYGDNTDGDGLVKWLKYKGVRPQNVVVAGNGATALAITVSLLKNDFYVTVAGRKEKGWEKKLQCDFINIKKINEDVLTINTTPLIINGKNSLDISYSFGSMSELALGMLAFQGFLSAGKWFQGTLISKELFIKTANLHSFAHQNKFLIYKLAGCYEI